MCLGSDPGILCQEDTHQNDEGQRQLLEHPLHPFRSGQDTVPFFDGALLLVSPSVWSKPHSSMAFSPCPLKCFRNQLIISTIYGTRYLWSTFMLRVSSEYSQLLGPIIGSMGQALRAICYSPSHSPSLKLVFYKHGLFTTLLHPSQVWLFIFCTHHFCTLNRTDKETW